MAIIHNEGKIDYIMDDILNDEPHIIMMLQFLKTHYYDDLFLQQCDYYTGINKIAIYLSRQGEIVFLNTTSYKQEVLSRYGRTGIILMPKKLKEEQIYDLYKLKDKLEKFNELQIWYNIGDNGDAQMKMGKTDIIDEYVRTKKYIKKKK